MTDLKVMSRALWVRWKNLRHAIPSCVACGVPIMVGDRYVPINSSRRKFVCVECSRKDVLVYQYPMRRYRYVGEKLAFLLMQGCL